MPWLLILRPFDGTVMEKVGYTMKITYENDHTRQDSFPAACFRKAVLAWLIAATGEYLCLEPGLRDLTQLRFIGEMSPVRFCAVAVAVFALLFWQRKRIPAGAERWAMALVFLCLSVASIRASFTWPLFAACLLVELLLLVYAIWGWNGGGSGVARRCNESRYASWVVAGVTVAFFLFVSIWTVCRVYSFSTPTYDFGIFSQMFHSMKTTGLPITTVERDGALSHFAVHVSPIYYLLLPFYWIVPIPATLQVLQAAVLASAVIPLWLLGKHHNLKPWIRVGLCLLLLLYPAYAGGTSYDIHENAFLTPLLLWLFYGIDRRSGLVTALAAVLMLMVKEDAAVYVAVVSVFLLLRGLVTYRNKWDLITGGLMLACSLGWFAAVTGYLATFGDGVMTYRYENFMYDKSGSLVTVIKAVLLCPMKAVLECVDPEKLEFLGLTMGALAFLPLMTRRYERLVLLIPYLLVNLMSDYQYQHDIFFQYTYGATAFLIYLVVVNLTDWKDDFLRVGALVLALAISLSCFCVQVVPKAARYPRYCKTNASYYDSLRDTLDVIPEGASAAATTYYTTYLSQRDVLYDIRYAATDHVLSCEYVAVGVTDKSCLRNYAVNGEKGYENFVALLKSEGYVKIAEQEGKLEIYYKEK